MEGSKSRGNNLDRLASMGISEAVVAKVGAASAYGVHAEIHTFLSFFTESTPASRRFAPASRPSSRHPDVKWDVRVMWQYGIVRVLCLLRLIIVSTPCAKASNMDGTIIYCSAQKVPSATECGRRCPDARKSCGKTPLAS
jgi:hypothetical protein